MSVGKRLKEARKTIRLTQAEFAERLGIKWFKVKDLESGRLKVTEELARKIHREFGINYKWVLFGEEPKELLWYGESGLNVSTVNAGPFVDIYDTGIAAKIAEAKHRISFNDKSTTPENPIKSEITMEVYFHDPGIIASVLARANGICEVCHAPAPFNRALSNTPFLEIHHKIPFRNGGDDSPDNIVVLCPNCHRKVHYG